MVSELFPIVTTENLPAALGFYRDLLGGEVTYEFRGPDGEVGYVGINLGSSHLGVDGDPDFTPPSGRRPISLWIYADDCDRTIDRLRNAGVAIAEEPADQPWGERVARVLDPDGNEVIVGARAA